MNRYIKKIESFIENNGGYREKEVIKNCYYVKSDCWNNEHKVIDVISNITDNEGYSYSFSIDMVTMKICG